MADWDERLSKIEQGREEAAEEARIAQEKESELQESLFSKLLDLARWAIAKYQSVPEPPIPIYVDGRPREEKPFFGKPRTVFPPRIQAGSGYLLYMDHREPDLTGSVNVYDPRAVAKAVKMLAGVNRVWLATPSGEVFFLSGIPFSSPEGFKAWDRDTAEWTVNNSEVAFKYAGASPEDQVAYQLKRAQVTAKERFADMADRDEFLDSAVKYVGERTTR